MKISTVRLVLVVSLLAVSSAFAQAVTASSPVSVAPIGDKVLALFVEKVVPVLFTALAGALTVLLAKLSQKAGAQAKESIADALAKKVLHFGEVVVHDLEATLKPIFLAATADGVLTQVEIVQLRAAALERFKALLKQEGLDELQSVLGIGSGAVDSYLHGVLEKAVAGLPASAKPGVELASILSPSGAVAAVAVPSQG